MSRSKKTASQKKSKKAIESESNVGKEIKGIIFLAIGLLLLIAIYTNLAGFLSTFAQKVAHLLLGVGAYLIPIYMMYCGYNYLKNKGSVNLDKKFYGISLFFAVIIMLFSTIYIQNMDSPSSFGGNLGVIVKAVSKGNWQLNGGIIAYLITYPLYMLIGGVGSYIFYGAITLIAIILVFNISFVEIGKEAKRKGSLVL